MMEKKDILDIVVPVERKVLGMMLYDFTLMRLDLDEDIFTDEKVRMIYAKMQELNSKDEDVSLEKLRIELRGSDAGHLVEELIWGAQDAMPVTNEYFDAQLELLMEGIDDLELIGGSPNEVVEDSLEKEEPPQEGYEMLKSSFSSLKDDETKVLKVLASLFKKGECTDIYLGNIEAEAKAMAIQLPQEPRLKKILGSFITKGFIVPSGHGYGGKAPLYTITLSDAESYDYLDMISEVITHEKLRLKIEEVENEK